MSITDSFLLLTCRDSVPNMPEEPAKPAHPRRHSNISLDAAHPLAAKKEDQVGSLLPQVQGQKGNERSQGHYDEKRQARD